jgi:hypothetical protein
MKFLRQGPRGGECGEVGGAAFLPRMNADGLYEHGPARTMRGGWVYYAEERPGRQLLAVLHFG